MVRRASQIVIVVAALLGRTAVPVDSGVRKSSS
jgi:hypothetical protein